MKRKIKALILFANPKKTLPLKTRKERKLIKEAIKSAKHLEVTFVEASTIHDLRRHLLSDEYHIVQISAHGSPDGLVLETEDGEPHTIEPKALANYLKKYISLECLILNACHSLGQGLRTMLSIPYTIAMEGTIADKAALEFSRGFYDVIIRRINYEEAYLEGVRNAELCCPDVKFRAELLKRDDSNREAAYKITAGKTDSPIKIFTNIWFEDHKYSIWSVRNPEIGTLSVFSGRIEFSTSETEMQITGIIRVRHTKMGGDVNNNWVEVLYQNGESVRLVYFSDASTLGVGNLIGGSEELFDFLSKYFPNPPPGENDDSAKGNLPPSGNIVSAIGSGSVAIGGNVTGSQIYIGNSTPEDPRKKK